MGAGPHRLLPYLGAACKAARERHGRLQVHIAVELEVDQATVRRFERGQHWPRDPDAMVNAYARDLDISPVELWRAAVKLWERERQRSQDS